MSTTKAELGRVLRVDAARIMLGDNYRGVDFAGAHVFARRDFIGVIDGGEGLDIGGDGIEGLAHFDRLRSVIVIDDGDVRADDFAAECVADDDQLQDGHHQRHDHQRGRAEELAHFALDNGEHSVHGCAPGRGGIMNTGLTVSSRNCRPV